MVVIIHSTVGQDPDPEFFSAFISIVQNLDLTPMDSQLDSAVAYIKGKAH
jgi:hypothetical protein